MHMHPIRSTDRPEPISKARNPRPIFAAGEPRTVVGRGSAFAIRGQLVVRAVYYVAVFNNPGCCGRAEGRDRCMF